MYNGGFTTCICFFDVGEPRAVIGFLEGLSGVLRTICRGHEISLWCVSAVLGSFTINLILGGRLVAGTMSVFELCTNVSLGTHVYRKLRSDYDELQLQYDDEVYNGGAWKRDRERLEAKISGITSAVGISIMTSNGL